MSISHEAIYRALYIKGAVRSSGSWWVAFAPGVPCASPSESACQGMGAGQRGGDNFQQACRGANRALPGHRDGDLIIGLNRSTIGTLGERSSRFTMLLHLPRKGYGVIPRTKNGPALADYGFVTMANALKNLGLVLDTDNHDEMAEAERINTLVVARAIAAEGACTGQHGVGTGKIEFMELEQRTGPACSALGLSRRSTRKIC